jgi:hypothetical protein
MTSQEHYREYLKSDHWRKLRCEAVTRWGDRCNNCEVPNVEVHHLAYGKWFDVTTEDLIPLCDRCHDAVHASPVLYKLLLSDTDSPTKRKTVVAFLGGRDEALKTAVKKQSNAMAQAQYHADKDRVALSSAEQELPSARRRYSGRIRVTKKNHQALRYDKVTYQWCIDNEIDPRGGAWRKKCIGRMVPKEFLL